MSNIVDLVCAHFRVEASAIAKPKYRHLKEYTYGEFVRRILFTDKRLRDEFSEMNETTILRTLKLIFPGKPASTRGYDKYFLSCIGMKKCHKCSSIKSISEFNKNKNETDGLDTRCRDCGHKYYNDNRDILLAQKREYIQENLPAIVAKNANRRSMKQNATPRWSDIKEITAIYNNCPKGYHVDHIVPLNGELVCGLHVEHNLQYLTSEDNLRKGNRFDMDNYVHKTSYVPPYSV